ncbi:sel1 repeat family protein [archaeon]|nr:MAG: sel1 repeat family protein [archaeon]
MRLYRLAAEQGLAAAQYSLATCLTDGFGTQRDYPQAAWWYYQAAKQGDMVCQNILARCYYVSRGVKRDYGRAVRWYIKAAQQGYVDAYTSIGKG